MKNITLRGIPENVYNGLRNSAARNHRSLNREIIACLERALKLGKPEAEQDILARIAATRNRMKGVWVTEKIMKKARTEGRP